MARHLAASVGLLLSIAIMEDVNAQALIGSGAHSCSQFLNKIRTDPNAEELTTQWALGFISGTVLTVPSGDLEFDLSKLTPEKIYSSLRDYCRSNPNDRFYEAVDHLLQSLPKKPSQKGKTELRDLPATP